MRISHIFLALLFFSVVDGSMTDCVVFPDTWKALPAKDFSSHMKVFIEGNGGNYYPPAIKVTMEKTNLSVNDYLLSAKKLVESSGDSSYRPMGKLQTFSGEASLVLMESTTNWGDVRSMQGVLVKNGMAYIITVSAIKEEFEDFYTTFFEAIRSFNINVLKGKE